MPLVIQISAGGTLQSMAQGEEIQVNHKEPTELRVRD